MTGSNLSLRLVVAGVGIPLGFAAVWAGGWVLTAVVAVLSLVAGWEVLGLARARGWRPFVSIALPANVLLIVLAGWIGTYGEWAGPALAVLLSAMFLSLTASLLARGVGGSPLLAVGTTLVTILYVALPLSFAIFLRQYPATDWHAPGWGGSFLVVFPLLVTWLGDSSAYFGGRFWGRRKLFPAVSPSKTVEGGAAGLLGSVIGAALFTAFLLPAMGGDLPLSIAGAAALGLLIGITGQVGDLAESLLKREAGIKDSGRILPGHGGVLDRFDAVLFTLPLTYAVLPLFLHWSY